MQLSVKSHDPFVNILQQYGFKSRNISPRQAPWNTFPMVIVHRSTFVAALAVWLFMCSRLSRTTKRLGASLGLIAMLVEPVVYGRSGLALIDYGMPAYGFLLFLHIVDVFFLRPDEEVQSWGFGYTVCQIFAYPKEDSTSQNPRVDNIKAMWIAGIKYLCLNLTLYFVPSKEIWATLRPGSLAYFLACYAVGMSVFFTLGFFVESVIRIIGALLGVEQEAMFDNPFLATNIRMFWTRWNKVIQEGLSRVFFHFKAKPSKKGKSQIPGDVKNGVAKATGVAPKQQEAIRRRFRNTDHLSETELSEASRPSSPEPKKKTKPAPPRKRSPFLPKALAALITFAASGAFHEFMNHLAFNGATGETILFFVSQALFTIAYSYIRRSAPGLANAVPTPLAILLTNFCMFICTPLFCGPFLRVGFFDDMKNFGLFGPVKTFVYAAGDGYGNNLPTWAPKWMH